MAGRPEHKAPPEIFYNDDEAQKYTNNTRIIEIQVQMCERAIELLALDPDDDGPRLICDIGCGSGLSGSVLEEQGHQWIGVDISKFMLEVATQREVEGDLILGDMGQGMPFKAGTFDGAVSISALQWLCNADKKSHIPQQRLHKFFTTLLSCLTRNARAVFQFYPENSAQLELITSQATKAGFFGGLVVDYPNSSKAKKYFLVLTTGGIAKLPAALGTGETESQVPYNRKQAAYAKNARGKPLKKSREWVLAKKEQRRKQGEDTRKDSRYTARKRSGRF
ncbi:probable 18S rRNA (guanine-N(7))-methyltransferase [Anopheles ziemanni]|uniref:probable 18S rRNA (guanine-N(7))-methyltransferase n=1 Tax=Anopheles coustani TaxID=139045 RepID=UPI00265B44C8|nr:probable 18S rRNA (guanine-N(7))-methyltransferase [Anopheles coustani]XP_058175229.1 probable 18S rRNA (guanine-N(7))-methyltransferase [Anopheles ziemanni]